MLKNVFSGKLRGIGVKNGRTMLYLDNGICRDITGHFQSIYAKRFGDDSKENEKIKRKIFREINKNKGNFIDFRKGEYNIIKMLSEKIDEELLSEIYY